MSSIVICGGVSSTFCSGTGTSYKTAPSPLGPWSQGKKISDSSCGGQPSFVSTIKLATGNIYLYGSDLWNNAAKNEALADYFWTPLSFANDGSIHPISCDSMLGTQVSYYRQCDIKDGNKHVQVFKADRTGRLDSLQFNGFLTGYPESGLSVALYRVSPEGSPQGAAIFSTVIPASQIGWSARQVTVLPGIALVKGHSYCFVVSSSTRNGCYGIVYRTAQSGKVMKFDLTITP